MPYNRKTVKPKTEEAPGIYKGYDLNWLKENPDHPDYYLVAEAESEKQPAEEVTDDSTEGTEGNEE